MIQRTHLLGERRLSGQFITLCGKDVKPTSGSVGSYTFKYFYKGYNWCRDCEDRMALIELGSTEL